MARTPPAMRDAYRAFQIIPTRWKDDDAYGHMNNAEYLSIFDTAVSLWQMEKGIEIRGANAARFLVVETGCRYHSEVRFPDILHVGLRIGHLGTSSFRYEIAIFPNENSIAATEGFFTQVNVGPDDRPTPIPDPLRAKLQSIYAA